MNFLVVGLGNIGSEYANTRHNMGFMVLDAWAQASNAVFSTQRYGDIAEVSFKGHRITLLKPSTYMNLSGKAVRYWMQEKKIALENLLIVSDDLNLPFGSIRMRKNGSDGGHNGLKNINELLGTQEYARIRLGIGNDFSRGHQIDFVLGKGRTEKLDLMPKKGEKVIEGVKAFPTIGVERAMSATNCRITPASQNPSGASEV